MKQKLSPTVAAIVIVVAILVVALTMTKFSGVSQGDSKTAVSGIPLEAQAEFQKRLGTGSQAGNASTTESGGGTAPVIPSPGGKQ